MLALLALAGTRFILTGRFTFTVFALFTLARIVG